MVATFLNLYAALAFSASTVTVVGKDTDGWTKADINLLREKVWEEAGVEKKKFEYVEDHDLSDGTTTFSVPPGRYRLEKRHYETLKPETLNSEEFQVSDGANEWHSGQTTINCQLMTTSAAINVVPYHSPDRV